MPGDAPTDILLRAPAKVNTGLRVLGRREDGMHELLAPTCLVGLCDVLRLRAGGPPGVRLRCNLPGLGGPDNLVLRAAEALAALAPAGRKLPGVDIALRKRIPAGAGLGGGSSDAAAALHGLNALWGLGLDAARLGEVAAGLGADVPFFVRGESGLMWGTGQRLLPSPPAHPWLLLLLPPLHCDTAAMYRGLGAPAWDGAEPDLAAALRIADNDFLPLALRLHPPLAQGRRRMAGAGLGAPRLSGSGGALFLPLPGPRAGRALLRRIPRGWGGAIVPCLARAPAPAHA